ncbi:uncharacterized protein LOC131078011 isoform X2 [Cryptomeria japonica]|uniref:uncharacterized protein LOC131078011 isoform X2 n=1 Tax=Cryptomeria japonica TaxID=3369 RepID=UPI0027DAA05A|nr:uncharacterized protein LOC131078011 isoform X2 [Cryptomeria japonica]
MEVEVGRWLSESIASDPSALRSATINLQAAEASPGFAMSLLSLSAVGQDPGQRTAAAIYLKNYVRNHWSDGGSAQLNERLDFRNQLVQVLLDADAQVVRHLAEVYSLIIANDFVRENTWPDLVTALRTAVQSSNLVNGATGLQWKTVNALIVLQTTIKPFQYFMNPKVAKEPVPVQLELIAEEILVPLCRIFHHFVQAEQFRDMTIDALEKEHVLLICCKCFHLAVRSHMPSSLIPLLPSLNKDIMVLLDSIAVDKDMAESGESKLKVGKRCLQIFCTLVTRHRKHTDKFMPGMVTLVLKIVKQKPLTDKFHSLRERIISLAFDLISHVLETGPGWRLVASHFSSILEDAIFPTLRMNQKDVVEWEQDPDEYMNKNLPSDLGEVSGWRDDLYTPRKSALNLLGVIALSKGPPMSSTTNKIVATKRKKGGKSTKGKGGEGSAGQLLVIPFLSKFVCPFDSSSGPTDTIMNYYGVLLGYGSLQEFFKVQSPQHVALLLRTRVLPLYSMSSPSPYLIANANWLLGELAVCLPELNQEIYNALLKALDAPNVGNISWRLVCASAAGALAVLLQEEYEPAEWVSILQTAISGITNKEKEDVCLLLQLLATAAEIGEEKVALHVPMMISTIKGDISRHIPPAPEPWPQVVNLGFSALAAMARCWDNAEPGENENGSISLENWKAGCVLVASSFSDLLQQAWLSHMKEGMVSEILPPPSCLNQASVLLCSVLKYINESELMTRLKVEALLQVWANLIAEWNAWDEEEDLTVFEAIEEATAFNEKFPLKNYIKSNIPPPPVPPVTPRSIVEAIATFISSAIELAYTAATWRACLVSHSLLHIPKFSFDSESTRQTLVTCFVQASYSRFQQLKSGTVPLGKPLVLVIAACYQCFPSLVEKILLDENDMHDPGNGFFKWVEALAYSANGSSEPCLLLESELKLGVMTLVKVLEHLLALACNQMMLEVAHSCYQSLLEATIRLKEVQEAEDREDDDDTEDDDDDDDGNEESDEEDEDSDDGGHEETEEEFLERYAETARELENKLIDEVDTDENGQEIELGLLGMADHWAAVSSLIQKYHCHLINVKPLPQELVTRFLENFPGCSQLFG